MIVCSCRAICERTLNGIIDEGAMTLEDVGRVCGAGTDCGACEEQIEELIASRSLVRNGCPANDTDVRFEPERRVAR